MKLQQLPGSNLAIDIDERVRALRSTPAGRIGAARATLIRFPDFRIDLITLGADLLIGRHANPGLVSVQCITGLIRMNVCGRDYDLPAGEALAIGRGVAHDVRAVRDSAFLVTIARPEADVPALFQGGRWVLPSREAAAPVAANRPV